MDTKEVSIIVVNWNGLQHLPVCLSSLLNQTYGPIQLILVDNGSTDGSVDYVREHFPTVQILSLEKNHGFCGGNNYAIAQVESTYVALINNDTEADPNWISESVNALGNNPEAGFVACRMSLFDKRNLIDTCGDLYFSSGYPDKRGWLENFSPEYSKPVWVFGASGGAVVYRKELLDQVGLFDEDYFSYQEDVDLSFRAQLLGYRCLYVPTAIVYHKVSATAGMNSPQRLYWSHRNHWFTIIKNIPAFLLFKYLGDILLSEIVVASTAIRKGNLRIYIKARFDVLKAFPVLLRKRRNIQSRRKVSIQYIDSIIRKDWLKFRAAGKKREELYPLK